MLHPLTLDASLPETFNDPFQYEPHPLCQQAARKVMDYVESQPLLLADARQGKMLGVLIVAGNADETAENADETAENADETAENVGFLAAYSGLLAGRNDWPWFVAPVFDAQQPDGHFKTVEREITAINRQLTALPPQTPETISLRARRKQMSEELQLWLFSQYGMLNARGERKDLVQIWRDYHPSARIQQRFPLPPGGSGDCCAPKLLQYAYEHHLRPLQIAEFWFGQSPQGEVRHHGHFYPACRGKCLPILTHMLQGLPMPPKPQAEDRSAELRTLYSDEAIIVVCKPPGMLSVPGKIAVSSVESVLSEQFGQVLMPHRLDMDTSGLMVVARTTEAYHQLQRQFLEHTVRKQYVALLEAPADSDRLPIGAKGTISLPLLPDPLDRPRQVVDYEQGKPSVTDYEVVGKTASGCLRLILNPKTGRTHQLRMHCAHHEGLGCPIVGDALYGRPSTRLFLHAEELSFLHPVTGRSMRFHKNPDF